MKFKRILCGVDFSESSVKAFETATELARSFKAELHVMHVIEAYPVTPAWLPLPGADESATSLEEKATAAMEALVARAARDFHGLQMTTEVTRGRAFVEILNRARARKVDLIVLGSQGLTLPEEAFFGSTVERVMKGATCSVLVVRG
jgi:nucleotide-binding universal stress UspA family protein